MFKIKKGDIGGIPRVFYDMKITESKSQSEIEESKKWVNHVKSTAEKNNKTYGESLKEAKETYNQVKVVDLTSKKDPIQLQMEKKISELSGYIPTNKKRKLVLLMILRDENETVLKTLNSVKNIIDLVIFVDTGSILNTIDIVNKFCNDNKIPVEYKSIKFEDFSQARNELLSFAYTKEWDYGLLLDANDEVNQSQLLRAFVDQENSNCSCFHLNQIWYLNTSKRVDTYWNIRLIKKLEDPNRKFFYKHPVHEYITNLNMENKLNEQLGRVPIKITQVRDEDNKKSELRFERDRQLLEKYCNENPKDTRARFYYSQTLMCMKRFKEAYDQYSIRAQDKFFSEEVFHSLLRMGQIGQVLDYNIGIIVNLFLKAYDTCERVEPLLELTKIFLRKADEDSKEIDNKKTMYMGEALYSNSLMYCEMAVDLTFPSFLALFVNRYDYDFTRYVLYAEVVGKRTTFSFANIIPRLDYNEVFIEVQRNIKLLEKASNCLEIVLNNIEKEPGLCDEKVKSNILNLKKSFKNELNRIRKHEFFVKNKN